MNQSYIILASLLFSFQASLAQAESCRAGTGFSSAACALPALGRQKCNSTVVSRIEDAIDQGKQVLVVASDGNACGPDDEACGDWADGLNFFADQNKTNTEVIIVSLREWNTIVVSPAGSIPNNSTLFLAKSQPSYFYSGTIFEPQVYLSVIEAWSGAKNRPNSYALPKSVAAYLCK